MKQNHFKVVVFGLILCLIAYSITLNSVREELKLCRTDVSNVFYDNNGKDKIMPHDKIQELIDNYYNYVTKEDSIKLAKFMYDE